MFIVAGRDVHTSAFRFLPRHPTALALGTLQLYAVLIRKHKNFTLFCVYNKSFTSVTSAKFVR